MSDPMKTKVGYGNKDDIQTAISEQKIDAGDIIDTPKPCNNIKDCRQRDSEATRYIKNWLQG